MLARNDSFVRPLIDNGDLPGSLAVGPAGNLQGFDQTEPGKGCVAAAELLEQGLAEIYDSQTGERYRQGIKACQGCAIRPACGGCQAVAFGLGLDIDKDPDPYCFIEK